MAGLQMGAGQVDEPPAPFVRLLCQVLPFVLSTEHEELAMRFLKSNTIERNLAETDLKLEFVKSAGKSDAEKASGAVGCPDKLPRPVVKQAEIIKDINC